MTAPDPPDGIHSPTAGTRVFAILGDPVGHSLSPRMQNAAFRALGLDAVYVAMRVSGDDLPGLLRGVARAGGGGNVTVPYKERAAGVVEEPTQAVVRTGACNTFWWADGAIHGDNTDVEGVRGAVHVLLGGAPRGARVLLLGAGGAARAAAVALLDDGVEEVALRNRTPARARELAGFLRDPRLRSLPADPGAGERWDLVVNATSLGLHVEDRLPLDPDPAGVGALLDLVYGPRTTPLVEAASARGIPSLDGGEMLLRQGMAAFRRWWGVPAPEEVMRAALGRSVLPSGEPA